VGKRRHQSLRGICAHRFEKSHARVRNTSIWTSRLDKPDKNANISHELERFARAGAEEEQKHPARPVLSTGHGEERWASSLPHGRVQVLLCLHQTNGVAECIAMAQYYSSQVLCVCFRGFLDDGNQVTFCTDSRSEKIPQMTENPCAHVCWYFPNTREQFRLDGKLQLVDTRTEDSGLAKVPCPPSLYKATV
jgi:hypothetical protein